MIVNVEKIKEDINTLKALDIDAALNIEVEKLRAKIVADRDAKIQKLESLLEMLERYEDVAPVNSEVENDSESDISSNTDEVSDDEIQDEDESDIDEIDNAENDESNEVKVEEVVIEKLDSNPKE